MGERAAPEKPLLTIGRGWAVYVGLIEPGRLHRHRTAQLAWSRQAMLSIEGAWGVLDSPGHFVPAGVAHRFVAAHPVRLVFLDPALLADIAPRDRPVTVAALTPLQAGLLEHELDRWLEGPAASEVQKLSSQSAQDPCWATLLHWLERALEGPVRVEDAAKAVELLPSRFMHWFAQTSGLSLRAYVRWLRLQRAARALCDGSTLAEAAYVAGFADSAHLTRCFIVTFGMRPASLHGARIVCDEHAWSPITPHGLAFVDAV